MLGGAIGTGLRMMLSQLLATRFGETFPVGTLVVNVTGCLVIGFFTGLTGPQGVWFVSPLWRQFVTIGLLGGYTTFSSFSLQTMTLVTDGEWLRAGLNILFSVSFCLLAAWLGNVAAMLLNHR